jgi:hypothetical protein
MKKIGDPLKGKAELVNSFEQTLAARLNYLYGDITLNERHNRSAQEVLWMQGREGAPISIDSYSLPFSFPNRTRVGICSLTYAVGIEAECEGLWPTNEALKAKEQKALYFAILCRIQNEETLAGLTEIEDLLLNHAKLDVDGNDQDVLSRLQTAVTFRKKHIESANQAAKMVAEMTSVKKAKAFLATDKLLSKKTIEKLLKLLENATTETINLQQLVPFIREQEARCKLNCKRPGNETSHCFIHVTTDALATTPEEAKGNLFTLVTIKLPIGNKRFNQKWVRRPEATVQSLQPPVLYMEKKSTVVTVLTAHPENVVGIQTFQLPECKEATNVRFYKAMPGNLVDLRIDKDNNCVIATDQRVLCISGQTQHALYLRVEHSKGKALIRSIAQKDNQVVFVGTAHGEIHVLELQTQKVTTTISAPYVEPIFGILPRTMSLVFLGAMSIAVIAPEKPTETRSIDRPIAMDACGNLIVLLSKYGHICLSFIHSDSHPQTRILRPLKVVNANVLSYQGIAVGLEDIYVVYENGMAQHLFLKKKKKK